MATGTESKIWAAIVARLKLLSPALPIAWPNVKFPATGAKPAIYLDAKQLRGEVSPIGIASWDERPGLFQVDVVYQVDDGIAAPTEIADRIAAHFPRNTILTEGGVEVRIDVTPSIASPVSDADATYLRIPVSIRYRSFTR